MAPVLKWIFLFWLIHQGQTVPLPLDINGYSQWEGDIFRRMHSSPSFFMAPADTYRQWLQRKVFYKLDPSYNEIEKSLISEAMHMIQSRTCIVFQERLQEADYVYIQPGENSFCNSAVGRNGGRQPLSLARTCFTEGSGLIVHEFLHTLGLWHEHNRPDRDKYVQVLRENIISDFYKNFQKRSVNVVDLLGIDYDYGSIMHYGMYDFSEQPGVKPTIIPFDNVEIGQRKTLSERDVLKINQLYKCDIKQCSDPPKTERVLMKNEGPWEIGAVVEYSCPMEASLIGSPRRFCRFDGKWSGNQPDCIDSKTSSTCNFEEGLCGWEQDKDDNFDWIRWNGATITEHTGPMVDHTTEESTGYYVYAEGSSPQKAGDVARLVSTSYSPSSQKTCLSLSYYMWGETVGTLNIYLRFADSKNIKIWTKTGNLGPTWLTLKLTFEIADPFKVVFECMIGRKYLSDVAIDDYVLRPCPSGEDDTFTDIVITPS